MSHKYAKAKFDIEGQIMDLFDHLCDAFQKDTVNTRAELNIGKVDFQGVLTFCEAFSLKVEIDYAENTIRVDYPADTTVEVIDAEPEPFTSVLGEPVVAN